MNVTALCTDIQLLLYRICAELQYQIQQAIVGQATTLDISSDASCISRGSISSVQGQFFSLN